MICYLYQNLRHERRHLLQHQFGAKRKRDPRGEKSILVATEHAQIRHMISQVHVTMKLPFRLVRNIGRFNTEWLGYLLSVILRETWSFDAEFFLRRPTNRKQI